MNIVLYILIGLLAGTLGGMFGIGGGVIIIPALVYFFGMTQQTAQGTSLALMLPPIGILAVLAYYKQGNVDIMAAVFICLGFLFGGLLGANIALSVPTPFLKKLFGVFLLVISLRMIFFK